MGKHFDNLVDVVKKQLPKHACNPAARSLETNLSRLVAETALWDFPIHSNEVFPRSGKDMDGYMRYISEHFERSREADLFFAMPFQQLTAIEDLDSVVFLETAENHFNVTSARLTSVSLGGEEQSLYEVLAGQVEVQGISRSGLVMRAVPDYFMHILGDGRFTAETPRDPVLCRAMATDLSQAAQSAVEEVVYIMDPENVVLLKETNQYRRNQRKNGNGKDRKPLKKTTDRRVYVCVPEHDFRELYRTSEERAIPIHRVPAHWRTYSSKRYTERIRGTRQLIQEYLRGNGKLTCPGGEHYQVMLRTGMTDYTPIEHLSAKVGA